MEKNFNSHAPCGAQPELVHLQSVYRPFISTHTPHAGRNYSTAKTTASFISFQLTRPMRGATGDVYKLKHDIIEISTHTPHAGRNCLCIGLANYTARISTHTPHAGRNRLSPTPLSSRGKFQLTRPMRGATNLIKPSVSSVFKFQLTRPMRGATQPPFLLARIMINFNSHAPCGAQLFCAYSWAQVPYFNSHAPCGAQRRQYLAA